MKVYEIECGQDIQNLNLVEPTRVTIKRIDRKSKEECEKDIHKLMKDRQEYSRLIGGAGFIWEKPSRVIYNPPATIVYWNDGSRTVVKCSKDVEYDPYVGFCVAIAKKAYGTNSEVKRCSGLIEKD